MAHESKVLNLGLEALNKVLENLELLHRPLDPPGGSVLLEELVQASNISGDPFQSFNATPLLHSMASAHAFIIMFVHVCRTGQSDIRNLSITHWGSKAGLKVLKGLSRLYTSLVWESTVLLALCSETTVNANWQFGKHQLERLTSALNLNDNETDANTEQNASTNMEIDENSTTETIFDNKKKKGTNGEQKSKMTAQMKQIKPLLTSASRLGRALAELFGLLVKVCILIIVLHDFIVF